jgi:hypothetical protein
MSSALRPEPSPQDCGEILDFLEGKLEPEALDRFIARMSAEPELLEAVEEFAVMDRLQRLALARGGSAGGEARSVRPLVRVFALASLAAAAVLLVALGLSLWLAPSPEPGLRFQVAAAGHRDELFSTLRSTVPSEGWYVGIQAEGPGHVRIISIDDQGGAHALELGTGRRSEPVPAGKTLSFGPYPRTWPAGGSVRSHAAFVVLLTGRELDEASVDRALEGTGVVSDPTRFAADLARELSGSAQAISVRAD